MNYIKRDIEDEFLKCSNDFPIVLLTGMRQCGKSTMLNHLSKGDREVVTLDDFQERALAKDDPQMFLQLHRPPLIINDVQYAPELFTYLKIHVDSHPDDKGQFWLTGSQPFSLMKLAGESLAGRAAILHMLPLSQHELYGKGEIAPLVFDVDGLKERIAKRAPALLPEVYERIFKGWMPSVAENKQTNPSRYYQSYLQTYIERDIRDMDSGAKLLDFSRFMSAVAAQISQLVNVDSLARDVGIPKKKAKEWLGLLERSDIIFFLQPYSNNVLSRAVKTPKLYFTDTGLAAWLGRWSSASTLENGALSGQIFENYVISELRKSLLNSGDNGVMWFYRDRDGKEIDCLVERDGMLHPIEVKRSANPNKKDIKAFKTLSNGGLQLGNGLLVCMDQKLGALDPECFIFPCWGI